MQQVDELIWGQVAQTIFRTLKGTITITGEFRAQRASNAENGSICWRHHEAGDITHWMSFSHSHISTIRTGFWYFLTKNVFYVFRMRADSLSLWCFSPWINHLPVYWSTTFFTNLLYMHVYELICKIFTMAFFVIVYSIWYMITATHSHMCIWYIYIYRYIDIYAYISSHFNSRRVELILWC